MPTENQANGRAMQCPEIVFTSIGADIDLIHE
jgi:hypothetical protein